MAHIYILCVPNCILRLVNLNTVHFNAVHLLCSTLISTRLVLSQITHCRSALLGSDNRFSQPSLLLYYCFLMANCKQQVGDYYNYLTAVFCNDLVHLTCIRMFHNKVDKTSHINQTHTTALMSH